MKKTIQALLLVLSVLAITAQAAAQTDVTVRLYPPQIDDFPRVSAYLDVHHQGGEFLHGLEVGDVTVVENGAELTASELTELQPGVQFVIALTPGHTYDVRDGQGVSRYEYLLQSMLSAGWDQGGDGLDDYSLVIAGGAEVIHTGESAELLDAMLAYEPPHGEITPDLEVLSRAIDIAADPSPQEGMERAVLFITPPLLSELTAGVQSLAGRANQLGVRLFIWLVAPSEYFPLPGATQLRVLAEENGGSYFAFSGVEEVPGMESYLEPLRYIYSLTYESRAAASGIHQFAVQISTPEFQASTSSQNFSLTLSPPSPIFVSPPSQIERTFQVEEDVDPTTLTASDLVPDEHPLRIRIEFPDGYERSIVRTVLYVDGIAVSENTSPPFDEFPWDLSAYTESARHTIQVEAIDLMGMSGRTIERSVQIEVPTRTQSILTTISRQFYLIALLVGLLLLALLGLGLVLSGRVRPRLIGRPDSTRRKEPLLPVNVLRRRAGAREIQPRDSAQKPEQTDQSLQGPALRPSIWGRILSFFRRPKHEPQPEAFASLTPLEGYQSPVLPALFRIVGEKIIIGSDPGQSTFTLDDPAVEPVHTYLEREDESLRARDAGTTAGTWVNYEQIPPEGVLLNHGDLLHVGRVGFRITLREPQHIPETVVITPDTPR